jgi:hypothetical protein
MVDLLSILNEDMGLENSNKQIRRFEQRDFWMMSLPEHEKKLFNLIPNYEQYLMDNTIRESSFTALINNKPIVCFGLIQLFPQVAEAWLIPSIDLRVSIKNAYAFQKATKKFFNNAFDIFDLRRIQVTIDETNTISMAWIKTMGFTKEGCMREFGYNKSDYFMFSRLKGE